MRILWPRSEIAGLDLAKTLERAGAAVTDPVAYRTLTLSEAAPPRRSERGADRSRARGSRTSRSAHRRGSAKGLSNQLSAPPTGDRGDAARGRELLQRLEAGEIDGVAFMSPSSARGLAAVLGSEDLSMLAGRVAVASIGPTTSAALIALGAPADVESSARSADALADALIRWLDARQEVSR